MSERHRIDLRPQKGQENVLDPAVHKDVYSSAWFPSRWSYRFLDGFMWRGFRRPLQYEDIPNSVEPSAELADAFDQSYRRYARVSSASLAFWLALLHFQRSNLLWSAVPGLLSVVCGLLQAIALYYLIGDMASDDSSALTVLAW